MINRAILQGRLMHDPELRQANGDNVCTIIISSQHDYTNRNEGSTADTIKCEAWGQTAEYISRHFSKGTLVNIDGSVKSRSRKDDVTGKWHYEQFVRIERIHFAPTNNRSRGGADEA